VSARLIIDAERTVSESLKIYRDSQTKVKIMIRMLLFHDDP
jgi:hypothetical protein